MGIFPAIGTSDVKLDRLDSEADDGDGERSSSDSIRLSIITDFFPTLAAWGVVAQDETMGMEAQEMTLVNAVRCVFGFGPINSSEAETETRAID